MCRGLPDRLHTAGLVMPAPFYFQGRSSSAVEEVHRPKHGEGNVRAMQIHAALRAGWCITVPFAKRS